MVTLKNAIEVQQPRYSDIKAPTIVMHGDADKTVSIAIHSRAFVREVAGSRLIELAGIGHMVQDAAPQVVVDAIESLMPRSQAAVAAATR
jgi:pimeloyl-ACP methyl ester carboxylesterase